MQTFLGNNEPEALRVVLSGLTEDTPYEIVRHGQDNLIILAAHNAYRFPRNQTVWNRAGIEHFVLETLRKTPELLVPILKYSHEDPAYTVSTKLDGNVLENQVIQLLSQEEQEKIGSQIGAFAAAFHQIFLASDIRPFLAEKSPQARYAEYLCSTLGSARDNTENDILATWILEEWPKFDHSDSTVIHDDLHAHNMLFDTAYIQTGVLDFGDVNLGNPEQDLRYTYWMGDSVMNAAISAYEALSGRSLNRELIKLCAVSQELSGLCDPKRSYMHARAQLNLSYRKSDLARY